MQEAVELTPEQMAATANKGPTKSKDKGAILPSELAETEKPISSTSIVPYPRPNIFVVGPSGSGKSTSVRNLNPERTVVINAERKTLPIPHANKFKKQSNPANWQKFNKALDKALAADVDVIVIDSFTAAIDQLFNAIVRDADDGRTAWGVYKNLVSDLFAKCKRPDKFVVFLAIEESVQDDQMRIIKSVGIQGAWKGKCESQTEIVLYTNVTMDHEHEFITNAEPRCSCKSPMGMLERSMPNDLAEVIRLCDEYYLSEDE